jgi:hypothetical protein
MNLRYLRGIWFQLANFSLSFFQDRLTQQAARRWQRAVPQESPAGRQPSIRVRAKEDPSWQRRETREQRGRRRAVRTHQHFPAAALQLPHQSVAMQAENECKFVA